MVGAVGSDDEVRTANEGRILVCQASSCHRVGSEAALLEIEELGKPFGCSVRPHGCLGACDKAPTAIVVHHGKGELYTHLDDLDRSAWVVEGATGIAPNLEDPGLRQRLADARYTLARQQARKKRKWNVAMNSLAEHVTHVSDLEARLKLELELADLCVSVGRWEEAFDHRTKVMNAAPDNPDIIVTVGTALWKLAELEEGHPLQVVAARALRGPRYANLLASIGIPSELSRHAVDSSLNTAEPREIEGYAVWTLARKEPVSRHSARYRFISHDHMRGSPYLRGRGRTMWHRMWHTTLLAMVGPNDEGPLPWIERDFIPVSTWVEWEEGHCDMVIKTDLTNAAIAWLHNQPLGRKVWLSQPLLTLSVPALVPDVSQVSLNTISYGSVLLILDSSGIAVAANLLHHADVATCFGCCSGCQPPIKSPISLVYTCHYDDVVMTADIAKWCRASVLQAGLRRCALVISSPQCQEQGELTTAPFPAEPLFRGLQELAEVSNVNVIDGRLTESLLRSELDALKSFGRCKIVVSGQTSFIGPIQKMLERRGVAADAITVLEI